MVETRDEENIAKKVKKVFSPGFKVLIGIAAIIIAILIIWAIVQLIDILPETLKEAGSVATETEINAEGIFGKIINIFLGENAVKSWELLILHIMVFAILFFALSDIVTLFGKFNETTSWVIGFGLAVIAGVSGGIEIIAGIFKFTATVGAVGIALMVIGAILAAVVLNLGIGGPLKKWRNARQKDIDSFRTSKGFDKVGYFIEGAGQVADAASEAGKKKKDK
jgi:hypothetical protein